MSQTKRKTCRLTSPTLTCCILLWVVGQQSPQCTYWILQQLEKKLSHLQPLNLRKAAVRKSLALQLAHIKRRTPLALQLAAIKKRIPLALLPAVDLLPLTLLPAVDLLRQGLLPAVDLLRQGLLPAVDRHLPTMWKMTFQCPKRKEKE